MRFGGPDDLRPDGSVGAEITLSGWFNRPFPIQDFSWEEANVLDHTFYPWYDYFSQPAVKNKMLGYSRFKAKLCLKFVMNASPYQYGAVLASYKPLVAAGTTYAEDYSGGVIDTNLSTDAQLVGLSQRPHVMLLPQIGNTATLELPFIYPMNYVDISSTTFADDMKSLGKIDLKSFGQLLTASSSVGPIVNMVVFAWAEDIDLQGPSYELQSGIETSEGEEFRARPVSTLASAVAAASSALSVIPVIGPYMKATSVIASSLGGLASWFGFSNTPPIQPVTYVKVATNPNLANAHIGTATEKLALDPKNELSIDPAIVGYPRQDELSLKSFCGRESYLMTTTWQMSDGPGLNLATIYVTPEMFASEAATTVAAATYTRVQMTPMCHAASLFTYWRGNIKFRFQILCSRFHRGRLRLYFDPNGSTSFNPLLQMNQVIDLATCTNFEFEVPYMAAESWKGLGNLSLTVSSLSEPYEARGNPTLPYQSALFNGCLRLEVLNDLVSPVTTADVQILVFVSAPDIEFAMPRPLPGVSDSCSDLSPFDLYDLQSGEDPNPMEETTAAVPQPNNDDVRSLVYMGERVVSLRELLKRTHYSMVLPPNLFVGSSSGDAIVARTQVLAPRLPRFPGRAVDAVGTNAVHQTAMLEPVNYVNFTPLNWVSMCFVGIRGSVVWRVNTPCVNTAENTRSSLTRIFISLTRRLQAGTGMTTRSFTIATGPTTAPISNSALNYKVSGYTASTVVEEPELVTYGASSVNPAVEPTNIASVPMFSNLKFLSANPRNVSRLFGPKIAHDDDNVIFSIDSMHFGDHLYGYRQPQIPPDIYVSAGDDFTLTGFVSVPTVYRSAVPITSPKT